MPVGRCALRAYIEKLPHDGFVVRNGGIPATLASLRHPKHVDRAKTVTAFQWRARVLLNLQSSSRL